MSSTFQKFKTQLHDSSCDTVLMRKSGLTRYSNTGLRVAVQLANHYTICPQIPFLAVYKQTIL